MANPFDVAPPEWYSRIAQPSNALNALGGLAGRYIGTAARAATDRGGSQDPNNTFYHRFRSNLRDSYKQDADPMFRVKEMRMKTEMAQFALNVENFKTKNELIQRKSAQEAQAQNEILQLQAEAQRNGEGPNGVLNTIYRGNNPTVLGFWNTTQLAASRQLTSMRINSDKTSVNSLIAKLSPTRRAKALSMPREEGTGLPTPETWAYIYSATAEEEADIKAKEVAKNAQQFKNLPLEAQMYERLKFYEQEGDELGVQTMQDALARKKSQQLSKTDSALLNDALSRRRQAASKLADAKTQLIPAAKSAAQAAFDAAELDVKRMLEMQSSDNPAPASTPATNAPASDPLGLFK